jgi:ribose transport system permease protein
MGPVPLTAEPAAPPAAAPPVHAGLAARARRSVVVRLLAIWVVMALVLTVSAHHFLTTENLTNIGRATAVFGVAAIGVTVALIAGQLDVSIGAVMSVAGILAAERLHAGDTLVVALALGVAAGVVAGLINGLLVVVTRIDALVVTLGTLSIFGGWAYLHTGGAPASTSDAAFKQMGSGTWLGIPISVWILAGLALAAAALLRLTVFGQRLYAVGDSARASRLAGLHTGRVRVAALMISGFTASVAGMLLAANAGQGNPGAGEPYLLNTLAAVVIGGTALGGGSGAIGGTIVGIAILGTIDNGLDLWHLSSNWQDVIGSAILVGALILDRLRVARREP